MASAGGGKLNVPRELAVESVRYLQSRDFDVALHVVSGKGGTGKTAGTDGTAGELPTLTGGNGGGRRHVPGRQ